MTPMAPFLDPWIASLAGEGQAPLKERLETFQAGALARTLAHARACSRFYRERLGHIRTEDIRTLHDVPGLPFTRPRHIRSRPQDFLCRSRDEISRIVTLNTSGTTARPKQVFFTDSDLEKTIDFFSAVLGHIMAPGDRGIIFLPGRTPSSAGDLIKAAMARIHAKGIVPGPITDFSRAADQIMDQAPALVIGMPVQILGLCEFLKARRIDIPPIPHVILTADHLPRPVIPRIENILKCRVIDHYGMTETGFGGAVQCPAQEGYHLREPDLFFEIIAPGTGLPQKKGQWGEIVVTTLNRTGMPLIRYRTGDISRLIDTPCACGSPLRRLDRIINRGAAGPGISPGQGPSIDLTMADLDAAFFAIPGIVDFQARICPGPGRPVLEIDLMGLAPVQDKDTGGMEIQKVIPLSPKLKTAIDLGRVRLGPIRFKPFDFKNRYLTKRQIQDMRSLSAAAYPAQQ